jgi:hypothetical protein
MTAIPHAAGALTSALGRFDSASVRALEAAAGVGKSDFGVALVEVMSARAQAIAAISAIRFSDDMWKALLDLNRDPEKRKYPSASS